MSEQGGKRMNVPELIHKVDEIRRDVIELKHTVKPGSHEDAVLQLMVQQIEIIDALIDHIPPEPF